MMHDLVHPVLQSEAVSSARRIGKEGAVIADVFDDSLLAARLALASRDPCCSVIYADNVHAATLG